MLQGSRFKLAFALTCYCVFMHPWIVILFSLLILFLLISHIER